MKSSVQIDYELAAPSRHYVVRALLNLEGEVPAGAGRIPLNLSLVLDRSGSMSGPKLAAARDAAALLVKRLHPDDVVSVVSYDDEVQTVAMPATGAEQPALSRAIATIRSGSTTNLSGGWLRGRELVATRQREGGVNRVILLTDGLANVGVTDPGQLVGLCRTGHQHGITTTTIGFGTDYNEHLLRAMADAGGGHTYYIERTEQAPGIFQEELAGLLTLSAQNLAVEVVPSAPAQLTVVHHSFPRVEIPGGLRLELGDLYAREPKKVLVEFVVPVEESASEIPIAELRVTADVLTAGGGVERQELRVPVHTSLRRDGHAEPEVRRELLLLDTVRARAEALEAEERGNFHLGETQLRAMAVRLRSEASPSDPTVREEIADLELMAERFASNSVSEMDRKYMNQRRYDSSRSKRASMAAYSRAMPGAGDVHAVAGVHTRHGDATLPQGAGRKVIAHVTDVAGQWGAGFARALSHRWPAPEAAYREWAAGHANGEPFQLGGLRIVRVEPELWVALLLAKDHPHGGHAPPMLRYDALEETLHRLAEEALRLGASVHMPRIACGEAGGDWDHVEALIRRKVCAEGVPVTVYDL